MTTPARYTLPVHRNALRSQAVLRIICTIDSPTHLASALWAIRVHAPLITDAAPRVIRTVTPGPHGRPPLFAESRHILL
jgi:hypothetical protein